MSEQEKYDLIVKASDLLYRVFEGKKNTHPVKYPVALGHEISGYV